MILIRNTHLIDGTGAPPRKADVLVKGDRILAVGTFPHKKADEVVDALGMVLAPGFIDVHNESDHYLTLFSNPSHEDFLLQGVTTLIGGQCGASLAPLLYGSLESIRKWADTNDINVNWHTMREFLTTLVAGKPLGVNWGTLVGHSTIRRALLGDTLRDLTQGELNVMERVVRSALEEGALGLSTGLSSAHTRGTPFIELEMLARAAAESGGVYATHLRDETSRLPEAMEELLRLVERTGARTVVSHFRPVMGFEQSYGDALERMEAHAAREHIAFDTNATDMSLVPLYTLLPVWAQRGSLETMWRAFHNGETAARIAGELPAVLPNEFFIMRAPEREYLEGLSLAAFAKHRGIRARDALHALMDAAHLRAVVLYRRANLDFKIQTLAHPRALIGSYRPSFSSRARTVLPRELSSPFTHYLETVRALRLLPFHEAIARITGVPAAYFGLRKRGVIEEGAAADCVLLNEAAPRDVWVNGVRAVRDGMATGRAAGRILTRTL